MEFLSDVFRWYWAHQPVMPFPFILPFVGAWWGEQVASFFTAPVGSERERVFGDRMVIAFAVWAIAAWFGTMSGHWYFLVPLAVGSLVWFFLRLAWWALTEDELPADKVTATPVGTPVADMDPAMAIRKAERAVAEYLKLLPEGSLDAIHGAELAGARLAAFEKLFGLLRRLDEVRLLDDARFTDIVRDADALFADVQLDPKVVEHYRVPEPSWDATRVTVRRALEALYYEILQLPVQARIRSTDLSVPLEYLRLTHPGENGAEDVLPDITIPEREKTPCAPAPPKLTA